MPDNVHICPFSKNACRNCPIYRGRHGYITCNDADGIPQARILKKDDDEWQERFKAVLDGSEESGLQHEEANMQVILQETIVGGNGEKKDKYKTTLIVLDRETGARTVCTISEARTWDWENRQKVRSIGPWHIYSFERLLSVLAQKAGGGCEEIELVEAPFYMGC